MKETAPTENADLEGQIEVERSGLMDALHAIVYASDVLLATDLLIVVVWIVLLLLIALLLPGSVQVLAQHIGVRCHFVEKYGLLRCETA